MADRPTTVAPAADQDSDGVYHVVVRVETDGTFFARSPQLPGLAFGAESTDELRARLDGVISFATDRPGPFRVALHEERHFDIRDRELVVRVAADQHHQQRREAYARLTRALTVPEQAEALLEAPAGSVGEVLYVCVVTSDPLEWVAAQLDPGGDVATLAVAIADEFLLTFTVRTPSDSAEYGAEPTGERRGGGSTVADLMRSSPILRPAGTRLTV